MWSYKRLIIFLLLTVFMIRFGFCADAGPTLAGIQTKLDEGARIYADYEKSAASMKHLKKNSPALLPLQKDSQNLLRQYTTSRRAAVEMAFSYYRIDPPAAKDETWDIDVDPFDLADWMAGPWGKAVLGIQAFKSPGWLGACLTALRLQFERRKNWPFLPQDQHLALTLVYRKLIEQAPALQLTADETNQLQELARRQAAVLDRDHAARANGGTWPDNPYPDEMKVPDKTHFYSPTFLNSSDLFFVSSFQSNDLPVSKVPVIVAAPEEQGYQPVDLIFSDGDGKVFINSNFNPDGFLLVPITENGPLPHRIPILATKQDAAAKAALSPLPPAVSPNQVQLFPAAGLDGSVKISLADDNLPILALAPSQLITKIPSRLPGLRDLKLTSLNGDFETQIPVVNFHVELSPKRLNRGETADFSITEYGAPEISAWAAVDGAHLVFDDMSQTKAFTLTEKQPAIFHLKGYTPGKFNLAYGIDQPSRDEAVQTLSAVNPQSDDSKKLLNELIWDIRIGDISETESLLEALRYQIQLDGEPAFPIKEIAPLIR